MCLFWHSLEVGDPGSVRPCGYVWKRLSMKGRKWPLGDVSSGIRKLRTFHECSWYETGGYTFLKWWCFSWQGCNICQITKYNRWWLRGCTVLSALIHITFRWRKILLVGDVHTNWLLWNVDITICLVIVNGQQPRI